jgi:hypothetical protein
MRKDGLELTPSQTPAPRGVLERVEALKEDLELAVMRVRARLLLAEPDQESA